MLASLVIPTLNEKDALKFLFAELGGVLPQLTEYEFEIIVVDDNSIDGTLELVEKIKTPFLIKIVKRREKGLATAVLEGWRHARGEILGVMDADLSHPPELIKKLLEALKISDLAVGSRHINGGGVEEWPIARRLFSKFATALARPLSGGVRDPLSGFFFIKKSALKGADLKPLGYKILLEILVKCVPLKITEVPYIFRNRGVGKSKLNWKIALDYFRHLLRLYIYKLLKKYPAIHLQ